MNLLFPRTDFSESLTPFRKNRVFTSLWTVSILSVAFIFSSCSSTEPLSEDSETPAEIETAEDSTPSIAGFIEFADVTAENDTVKTRLSDASLSIRDLEGLPLSTARTNIRGEFFIELDAFRPGEQYDLFVYSSSNGIIRNIRFIYTINDSNNIELLLDRGNRTEMNIDYLDLNTGEGSGAIITN